MNNDDSLPGGYHEIQTFRRGALGESGFSPTCVFGSGAASLQPLSINALHSSPETVISSRLIFKMQLPPDGGTPSTRRATR